MFLIFKIPFYCAFPAKARDDMRNMHSSVQKRVYLLEVNTFQARIKTISSTFLII